MNIDFAVDYNKYLCRANGEERHGEYCREKWRRHARESALMAQEVD